jgi:cold shock protein
LEGMMRRRVNRASADVANFTEKILPGDVRNLDTMKVCHNPMFKSIHYEVGIPFSCLVLSYISGNKVAFSLHVCYTHLAKLLLSCLKHRRISIDTLFCDLVLNTTSMNGEIKKLVSDKGFGFISFEGSEKDLFFHRNALVEVQFDDLKIGDAVTFDVEDSAKGKNAVNVKRA